MEPAFFPSRESPPCGFEDCNPRILPAPHRKQEAPLSLGDSSILRSAQTLSLAGKTYAVKTPEKKLGHDQNKITSNEILSTLQILSIIIIKQ